MSEIRNAKISSTTLGPRASDGRCFSLWVSLEWKGGGQGFGGFTLDAWNEAANRRTGGAWGMEFIAQLLEAVGVESWDELIGKHVRIDHEPTKILGIGHIIDEKWFYPEKDLKFLLPDKGAQ